MPSCGATIPLQPCLCRVKRRLTDECWHGHGKPVLGWGGPMTHARPHRPQSGLALPGWHWAALDTVSHPGIDLIMQDPTHAGGMPPRLAHRGRELSVAQPLGDSIEGARRLRIRVPG